MDFSGTRDTQVVDRNHWVKYIHQGAPHGARHTLRNDQQPFPTGCQLVKKISVPACVRMLKMYVAIEFRCGMMITCRGLSVTPVFTEKNKDGHE